MITQLLNYIKFLIPTALIKSVTDRGEIAERIAKGSFWLLIGSVFSRGISVIISIFIARLLGQTLFGQFAIIQSTILMFSTFAGFGLGITSTKYVAELRNFDPELAGNIISSTNMIASIMGLFFTILILLLSPFIATNVINAPFLIDEIRIGSIILFFSALNGAQTGALAGFEAFKDITKINIIVSLIYLPIQIVSTLLWGLEGAIIGLGANYFTQYIFNYKVLRKIASAYNIEIKYFTKSLGNISYLWKFSLPAVLAGILVNPVMWYCSLLLVRNVNGFNEMAIYNAAFQWQNVILFVPMAISQIALPLFSNIHNDKNSFKQVIKYNLIINITLSSIIAIVFSIFSKLIMKSYGNEYAESNLVLILISFTAILIAANNVIGQAIAGLGKMWIGFSLNFFWAISLIVLASIFIQKGEGSIGLAKALLLSYLLLTFLVSLTSYYYLKNIKFNIRD
jgi:O-antigen/teichoic acid export membrane protein